MRPDAQRARSTALRTDFAAQAYTLLGTVLAVVRFPRGAQGAARHGVCSGLAAALCGGLCGTPVQTVAAGPDQKDSARPAAQRTRFMQEKRKKAEKCVAKQAHNII